MTIEFKISALDRNTANGFVTTAHWTASKTVDGFSAGSYGAVGFTKEDGVNLIPYADLTEATVIGWVEASLGAETLAAMEATMDALITEQQAPSKATGIPWGN
jgi:fructose-specific phosphotransferase system IIC component